MKNTISFVALATSILAIALTLFRNNATPHSPTTGVVPEFDSLSQLSADISRAYNRIQDLEQCMNQQQSELANALKKIKHDRESDGCALETVLSDYFEIEKELHNEASTNGINWRIRRLESSLSKEIVERRNEISDLESYVRRAMLFQK